MRSFLSNSGFTLAIAAFIGAGVVSYRGMHRYADALEQINQTQKASQEQSQRALAFYEEEILAANDIRLGTERLAFAGGVIGLLLSGGVFFLLKRDVNRLRRSESALSGEHRLMRELINHIPEAVYVKDTNGRYRIANRAFRKYLTGDEKTPVENKTVFDFVDSSIAKEQDKDDQATIRARRPSLDRTERNGIGEAGNRWFITTKVPLLNNRGECTDLLGIHRDVTASRQAQEELRQAKQFLESASRAKTDFLANMSHEIRTPMNGILGMIELSLDTDLNPQQREYVSLCKNSAQSLLDLLNDILDYSRGEDGAITLENTSFDLQEILSQVITPLTDHTNQKQIRLGMHVADDVPRYLRGDPARLRQILVNLVGNAVKFTESGEVALEIKVESGKRDEASLQFSIRDTGMGVAEAKRAEIFDAFSQADSSHARRFGGVGLGLTIASRLVKLMGGRIWFDSKEGIGSTFHFTAVFGVSDANGDGGQPTQTNGLSGLSVLVVDPDFTSRRVLEDMLQGWQMTPKSVPSGDAALDALHAAFQEANPFPLVLMDARMPEMDGDELARLIKSEPELQGTRLILLSSVPELANSERARLQGFSAALPKPIRPAELLEVINRTFSVSSEALNSIRPDATVIKAASSNPTSSFPPAPAKGFELSNVPTSLSRILVAEDNPVNQAVAVAILSKRGHQLVCAKNGVEAVAVHSQQPLDLILMDIQMPEMDGYTAVRHIRQAESKTGRHTPIIAVTAHAMKGDRERCLSAGMDAYISKPFAKEELVRLVESFEVQPAELPSNQALAASQAPEPFLPSDPPAQKKHSVVADREQLISELGDKELVVSLIDIFLEQIPKLLSDLDLALVSGNAQVVDRTAHTLKGSVGNFGATDAFRLAEAVEEAAKAGDLSAAAEGAKQFRDEIKLVMAALSKMRC